MHGSLTKLGQHVGGVNTLHATEKLYGAAVVGEGTNVFGSTHHWGVLFVIINH